MATPSPSVRQQELERRYLANQARRNNSSPTPSGSSNANPKRPTHQPQPSISDDNYHVTEAIGSWYGHEESSAGMAGMAGTEYQKRDPRPLSYIGGPSERESFEAKRQRRHGTLLDSNAARSPTPPTGPTTRTPLAHTQSNERVTAPTEGNGSPHSPKSLQRMSSLGSENMNGASPTSSPPLSRQPSSDAAVQQFPLNDIDYESSPEAVKQEISNLNALRRMSMNIEAVDPDLPTFSSIPTVAPKQSDNDDDPSKLFWVPARLHPELAPKEFKTFIEDKVDRIRRRSGGEDNLSPDGLERSGSGSSLRRKKSMLSHQIDTKGSYEDGADRLERKRSSGMTLEGQATVENLSDLEALVNDPSQLIRRMSLDTQRRSLDSGAAGADADMPILPPATGSLKRSTRTQYRRGSLKKGERVPFSKRTVQRHAESDSEENPMKSPVEPPVLGLTRIQTEPTPPSEAREDYSRSSASRSHRLGQSHSSEDLSAEQERRETVSPPPATRDEQREEDYYDDRPQSHAQGASRQPAQFQSRIASSGRTTAQLPGYNNTNPLPNIIETLPDGTKVPVGNLAQNIPERKSSHEVPRQFQRGGAHMRPVPGREKQSSLDDISSHPSPLPGSSNTRTDALTLVPTFDEKKSEKKDPPRKSSWKWILGSDDNDKEKKSKDDANAESSSSKSKGGKTAKGSTDKARLDVLQNSIDGTVPARGRESLVLNREDIKLEDERRKDSKKAAEPKKEKDGLLSTLFGGKKKTSDSDLKEKKRKADRNSGLSAEVAPRILKPDIDYNWTRFSILEERAIYRMAHIKLANPRRALYSQVLLSNFMYSYLAKVQMMHPQIQIPAAQRAAQQKQQQQQQEQQSQQPPEYNQYQRWQEQQAREQAAQEAASGAGRTSFDMVHGGDSGNELERGSAQDYGRQSHASSRGGAEQQQQQQQQGQYDGGDQQRDSGYSVASTHDYLGYSNQQGLWENGERSEELW
ncbi:hypothetical protein DOTSEDRAFT_68467 [Lecanosticta acicola]|uniref:Protein Zds1 C-terminal domain-containing protein n=1 Tax=Lecanosticta acicola TaxID=111012 RepID=A0AAI8YWK5_9PEZI|nr:hypothetical protein DOTSEDRAFT_68467 [Lecanosticta acicola]